MDVSFVTAGLAIGFGATSRARADDVVALVRATLTTVAARGATTGDAGLLLATIDRRADLGRDVSRRLGYALVLFDAATLARVAADAGLTAASPRALERVGAPSVAEAAALAAFEPLAPRAHLVAQRRTGRGCTCAIARPA